MSDGQKPKYLPAVSLAQNFGLEMIESVIANHADTILARPEQIDTLRLRLMPLIIKVLSERASFSTTVRVMRLLQLIISYLLDVLALECEMALSLLNHMLDPAAAVLWKRALCLEVFRLIHMDPTLVRNIYAHYDEEDEKRNIVRDHLGSIVRLASEKPAVIGLGQQSSIPTSSQEIDDPSDQAAIQAANMIGGLGAVVTVPDSNSPGISTQWSSIRAPCLDQLDKSEAPSLPATYIYSLALTCINSFSEGLARFLLPFTVPVETKAKRKQNSGQEIEDRKSHDSRSSKKLTRSQSYRGRKVPINPLSLKDHVLYDQISISGHMVDHCWPALLAASSTFLNATLDSDHYHALIRSFQKFAQIAGLLDLTTPRDAFLTTLGKHAVPPLSTASIALPTNERDAVRQVDDTNDIEPHSSSASTDPSNRRQKLKESGIPMMNTRHLLCLRALLNLGIALGPVLQSSWAIILESLQQADLVITLSTPARQKQARNLTNKSDIEGGKENSDTAEDLRNEITAADTAASRLFESTADLPNEAFLGFVTSLCSLLQVDTYVTPSTDGIQSEKSIVQKHTRMGSLPGAIVEGDFLDQSDGFVLDKIDDTIRSNVVRLLERETLGTGWNLVLDVLIHALSSRRNSSDLRLKAARTLNDLFVAVAISEEALPPDQLDSVRARSFDGLQREINSLRLVQRQDTKSSHNCDVEIHRLALEALKCILEHCGESINLGWNVIFDVVNSNFDRSPKPDVARSADIADLRSMSPILVRSSFDSLQLICSDFLGSVPFSCLLTLLDTLYAFCAQQQDLNISLTVSALSAWTFF